MNLFDCRRCRGTGTYMLMPCEACDGTGKQLTCIQHEQVRKRLAEQRDRLIALRPEREHAYWKQYADTMFVVGRGMW